MNLTEAIVVKISHDLAGGIGAMASTTELMEIDPTFVNEAGSMLRQNSLMLMARLRFYRALFGAETKEINATIITDYLKMRRDTKNTDPLFASLSNENFGGRLTTYSISQVVKSAFKKVGLNSKRLTAHSLRHSAATAMLLKGVDLVKVQQILRHKNVNIDAEVVKELV